LLALSLINNSALAIDKKKIKIRLLYLIEILTKKNVLSERVVRQGIKTIKLKKINYESSVKNKYFELEYYEQPYCVLWHSNKLILLNAYLFSIKFAIRDNRYNLENIKIKDVTFLQNALATPYFVERELIPFARNALLESTNFSTWDSIISGEALESLKKKNTSAAFDKLKKNLEEAGVAYNKVKTTYTSEYKEIYRTLKEAQLKHKSAQQELSQQYSVILMLNIFNKFAEEMLTRARPFYLASYIDFRGRIYSDSKISPTSTKIYRHLYHYGFYSGVELNFFTAKLASSRAFKIISAHRDLLYSFEKKYSTQFTDLEINALLWLFLELGKLIKGKLLKNGRVSLREFLEHGIISYSTDPISENFEDKIIYKKVCEAIHNIFLKKKIKKTIIYKDSTASVLQQLTKLLGHKSEKILEIMNINHESIWYDPYSFIIDIYKIKSPIANPEVEKLFIRKILKKLIMTVNYSLTQQTALTYFFEDASGQIELAAAAAAAAKKTKPIFLKELRDEVRKFFYFLKNNIETEELFERNSKDLIKNWNKDKILTTTDGNIINLNYKKLKKTSIETTVTQQRKSMINYQITQEHDRRKTNIALRANIIHTMDSHFVREILKEQKIITIHDSFGIAMLETPFIIDLANKAFVKEVFNESLVTHEKYIKNTYSIFIIL